jgi:riboflavin transporter FmnP
MKILKLIALAFSIPIMLFFWPMFAGIVLSIKASERSELELVGAILLGAAATALWLYWLDYFFLFP